MFQAHVFIVRRAKLYYTVSGIITLKQVSGLKLLKYFSNLVSGLKLLKYFNNFRPLTCFSAMIPETIIQFCPPDDERMCSKHVEA